MSRPSSVDWELVERDYRAGIKSVRQIAKDHGVSHVAIGKRAEKFGWIRDLTEKIQQQAQAEVTKAVVSRLVNTETKLSDVETVKAYGNEIARVDLVHRDVMDRATAITMSQLDELAALGDPRFRDFLEAMAEAYDQSGPGPSGAWKTDKTNELYRYITSIGGRVKMAKDIAGAYGTHVPMHRKMLRLDEDSNKGETTVDSLLAAVLASS